MYSQQWPLSLTSRRQVLRSLIHAVGFTGRETWGRVMKKHEEQGKGLTGEKEKTRLNRTSDKLTGCGFTVVQFVFIWVTCVKCGEKREEGKEGEEVSSVLSECLRCVASHYCHSEREKILLLVMKKSWMLRKGHMFAWFAIRLSRCRGRRIESREKERGKLS